MSLVKMFFSASLLLLVAGQSRVNASPHPQLVPFPPTSGEPLEFPPELLPPIDGPPSGPIIPVEKVQSVRQVEHGRKLIHGPSEFAHVFRKYGKTAPANVLAAEAAVRNGTVVATDEQYDTEYLCPVTIGSQQMMLDFDTGSSDLWVFSTALPAQQRGRHALYNLSGRKAQGESWRISYGDGSSASGDVYQDTVTVAGVSASMGVEAAKEISAEFRQGPGDGLLGLAFDSINTCQPRICSTFTDNADLTTRVFAAKLEHDAPGSYDFGYLQPYAVDAAYSPVNTANGFWEFTSPGFSIGNEPKRALRFSAIADTGTTLMFLPPAIVSAYWSKVPRSFFSHNEGTYIFPCDENPPTFSIWVDGQERFMPGSYMNFAPVLGQSGYCTGALNPNTGLGGLSILGDAFLKSQYVIFDMENKRLGFVQRGVKDDADTADYYVPYASLVEEE